MQQYATFIKTFEDPSPNDFSIDKTNDASGERKTSVIPKIYPKYNKLSIFNSDEKFLNKVLKREFAYNSNVMQM
jgi:hypothetical protein